MLRKLNTKSFFIANILFVLCLFLFANNNFRPVAGETTFYTITLNQTTPATIASGVYGSGTEINHYVAFNYVDAKDNASYHTELKASTGAIYNDAATQITSITKITAVFSGILTLTTGTSANPTTNAVALTSNTQVTLANSPYFFKIAAGGSTTYLTSLTITYSCTPAVSSSSEAPVASSISISRTTWTSLSTYPTVETSVAFSGYNFKFFDAGNYTAGVIQGRSGTFYMFNSDTLGTQITSIVLTLTVAHPTHVIYAGTSANPTTNSITPTVNSLVYTYDFSGGTYQYFRIFNTSTAIYISSMVINFLTSGTVTSSSSSSSLASSSSTSTVSSSSFSSSSAVSSSSSSTAYGYNYVTPSYTGTYYSTIADSLRDNTLLLALDDLLDPDSATGFTYTGLSTVFPYTDADPSNTSSGKILSFYSGTPSVWSSMNREHVWPDSRGGNFIETDPHMVRPTLTSENSSRGNSFYNVSPTLWDPATFGVDKYRGIAARIIMYCAVKAQENGLTLVDKTDDPYVSSWPTTMGKLSTLLLWNLTYDIDATETLRNDVLVSKYGHNRNPFIDDRNYGCKIWGNTNATTKSICGM